ncbi:MAG TPA: NAD-dependent epimerase/dehydratase family protein [Dehalococcoidia bacterium]|nr:NAD-dependent epimerase/dehydratase family protein [Dehalococcoidia bacterium]
MSQTVLVTGAAGFIGSHVGERLLDLGYQVVGLDNFDDSYEPQIKRDNIQHLTSNEHYTLIEGDIRDRTLLHGLFTKYTFDNVIHLAAKAGVRPSIIQPQLYEEVNVQGTINLLEESRLTSVERFIFTSSSSVYGNSTRVPFKEDQQIATPMSPYAASKATAELYCYTYHHLYELPMVIIRPFNIYGPRQRPGMAIPLFTRKLNSGEEIQLFGDGSATRDHTHINDFLDGLLTALTYEGCQFDIFNLGNSRPISLDYLVQLIEESLGKKAKIKHLPVQPGDVPVTFADISKAQTILGYQPKIAIEQGIPLFIEWYRNSQPSESYIY